ncbi:hypothetical protein M0804_005376 [Polistes exclamans]|nr:hypothetical protein M0804_005376 [Polistes exclamans]
MVSSVDTCLFMSPSVVAAAPPPPSPSPPSPPPPPPLLPTTNIQYQHRHFLGLWRISKNTTRTPPRPQPSASPSPPVLYGFTISNLVASSHPAAAFKSVRENSLLLLLLTLAAHQAWAESSRLNTGLGRLMTLKLGGRFLSSTILRLGGGVQEGVGTRISRAILSGVIIRCITWYNKGFEPPRGLASAVGRFRTFEMKLLMRGESRYRMLNIVLVGGCIS